MDDVLRNVHFMHQSFGSTGLLDHLVQVSTAVAQCSILTVIG